MNKWTDLSKFNLDSLSKDFQGAEPFNNIVIDNFFNDTMLDCVLSDLTNSDFDRWDKRDHKNVQVKWRSNWQSDIDIPSYTFDLIQYLNSGDFLRFLSKLTGIQGLIPDPYLTGGGFNQINPGGMLEVHADGNWHDLMGVHRRLNVIVYLNKNWQDHYNGGLELWSKTDDNNPHECVKTIMPLFNRLCVFKTDDFSFHGHPKPVNCPADMSRKSLILYYYTNTRPMNEVVSMDSKHRALFYNTEQS